MGCTLVIDTSFGSTVGIVGREPIVETDSRTHVEKLQVNIARAVEEAGLTPADIEEIVVGIGPAPFTGLRAGIVAAKALAFATGAKLVGQNVLDPQGEMMNFVLGDSAMFDGIDFLADVPRLSSRQSDVTSRTPRPRNTNSTATSRCASTMRAASSCTSRSTTAASACRTRTPPNDAGSRWISTTRSISSNG